MKILFTLLFALIVATTAAHAGTLKLESLGYNFGSCELGIISTSDPITITNYGTPTTLQLPLQPTGPHASQFSIIQPATATLGDGESVTFRVVFHPNAVGSYDTKVFINSNAAEPSIETSYSGAGVTGPPSPSEIPTAFTYQGKLTDGGAPANGTYDFEFRLFDQENFGAQIGSEIVHEDVYVSSGVFTVLLDFGRSPFMSRTGNYLDISVRTGSATGSYTALSPRQPIRSSPYAVQTLRAETAAFADNANALGGLSAKHFVQTKDPRLYDERPPQAGSFNYIQNGTGVQPLSNFNIGGNGTVAGTLSGGVVNAATQFNHGGVLFARGDNTTFSSLYVGPGAGPSSTGLANAMFGANAGAANTTGEGNSFFGTLAGWSNVSGYFNSYFGRNAALRATGNENSVFGALAAASPFNTGSRNSFFGQASAANNSSGSDNVFVGFNAGERNRDGSENTIIGSRANFATLSLSNASAIGARALVSSSNSMVLGSIAGINGAAANTNVGIGTSSPNFRLHVRADGLDGIKIQHTGVGPFPLIRWTDSADATKASIGVDAGGAGSMRFLVNGFDRLTIESNGLIRSPGAIYISNPNTLLITSPNGACWGITVSNTGALSTFPVACP